MSARRVSYPGASRILENSIVEAMIVTFKRYNSSSPREPMVVELMNGAVLSLMNIFLKDSHVVFSQEPTTSNVYAPISCYRILTIRRRQLITHAFLAIAPYVAEEDIHDLAYQHVAPIMDRPCMLPVTGDVPHWVILVTGTEEISVRFFYNRPATDDLESTLIPIRWNPDLGRLERTTIHERLELDPDSSMLDETLRKLQELSALNIALRED